MKKLLFISILSCGLWIADCQHACAQGPAPPPGGGGGGGSGSGTDAPIDKEVIFLLMATAALGTYKLKYHKNQLAAS